VTGISTRELIQADVERRLRRLPAEIEDWKTTVAANVNGLAIHVSQMVALRDMMTQLCTRQTEEFQALLKEQAPTVFADSYYDLLNDMGGTNDLWRIFRIIFDQRQNQRLKPLADTLDLVAWDCYRTAMEQARSWGILSTDQFRPPPLSFLESSLTPATVSRGESVEALGFAVRRYRDIMLPLPIVLYPVDQAASMWSMSSIAHEVGHNLDHDLHPDAGKRLSSEYNKRIIGLVDDQREPQWRRCMEEIFADAVAVTLCGAGFVTAMKNWIAGLAPGTNFQNFDIRALHPPFFLRLRLLGHMLVSLGGIFTSSGKETIQFCDAQKRPGWESPYEAEAEMVAKLLICEPVPQLGNHALAGLNDDLLTDEPRTVQLAIHWLDPGQQRPDPVKPRPIPFRTVCAAAALAAAKLVNPTATMLDDLQHKAENYLSEIPRPHKLATPSGKNMEFLGELTRRLKFGPARLT